MSLLDYGHENVVIFHEVSYTDADGNTMYRPGAVGVAAVASIQPVGQSGTSSRRAEQNDEGYETEETYRMRMPRSFSGQIGTRARVEWRGESWSVFGEPRIYASSRRTAHSEYRLRRN